MDFIIIIGNLPKTDIELFFGPLDKQDVVFYINESLNMGQLLKKLDLIPSVAWARKCGWLKPIEKGFTDFRFGKKKTRISILKEF